MATYFLREDSTQATKKRIKVPDNIIKKAKELEQVANDNKKAKGSQRVRKIANMSDGNALNKQNKDKKGSDELSFAEVKLANHEMSHMDKKSAEYALNMGEEGEIFYKNALSSMRNAVKETPIVQQVKQNIGKSLNPTKTKSPIQDIKVGTSSITLKTEGIKHIYINENQLHIIRK